MILVAKDWQEGWEMSFRRKNIINLVTSGEGHQSA
jgi:hypothetical protein